MSSDDPFADDDNDKTILRPMPGGRRSQGMGAEKQEPVVQRQANSGVSPELRRQSAQTAIPEGIPFGEERAANMAFTSGVNPLVSCASSLLALGARLRHSISQDSVSELKDSIIQQLRIFEDKSRASGIDQDTVLTARYLLCTYLDGAIASTPWGSESGWSNQSLLSIFHNETWGGEKFFQILDQHMQSPARSVDLLELIFVCLSLGFQGRYSLSQSGNQQLVALQDALFKTISVQRGEFERELSPHWQGINTKRTRLTRYVPLWVIAAVLGVLLLGIYVGFRSITNASTSTIDSIFENLQQTRPEQSLDII